MVFTANTAPALAQIGKLQGQMTAFQSQMMAMNAGMAGFGSAMKPVALTSAISQMDQLTSRIQKGKITQKEFQDTIRGTNKLYEYQNSLQKATLAGPMTMGRNGKMSAQMVIPELKALNGSLATNARMWATASAAAKAYGTQVMNTGKNMAFMGRQALLSVTGPALLIGGALAASFYQVDKQLVNIEKLYGGIGDAANASSTDVRAAARGLSSELNRQFGASQKDTLELVGAFAALGESGQALDQLTSTTTKLMLLGDVTTESATKMVSTLRTTFKMTGEELDNTINMMNTFENSSTLKMQDFADGFPRMASVVESWGGTMRDSGMILEAFTSRGISAVEGANSLKTVFAKIARPTKQVTNMFADLTNGMDFSEMARGLGNDVTKVVEEIGRIQTAFDWSNEDKQMFAAQMAGAHQVSKFMALTAGLLNPSEQLKKIKNMTEEELADFSKMMADREQAAIMQSASKQFQVTINKIKMIAEKAGESILPVITKALNVIMDTLQNMFAVIKKVFDALGPLKPVFKSLAVLAGVIAVGFAPVMLMLSSFFLIKGGIIAGLGMILGLMNKVRGKGTSVPLFQTSSQRAATLQAQEMKRQQMAQVTSSQALTSSLDRLSTAYNRVASSAALSNGAIARAADTQASAAARATSATNLSTSAVIRNTDATRNNAITAARAANANLRVFTDAAAAKQAEQARIAAFPTQAQQAKTLPVSTGMSMFGRPGREKLPPMQGPALPPGGRPKATTPAAPSLVGRTPGSAAIARVTPVVASSSVFYSSVNNLATSAGKNAGKSMGTAMTASAAQAMGPNSPAARAANAQILKAYTADEQRRQAVISSTTASMRAKPGNAEARAVNAQMAKEYERRAAAGVGRENVTPDAASNNAATKAAHTQRMADTRAWLAAEQRHLGVQQQQSAAAQRATNLQRAQRVAVIQTNQAWTARGQAIGGVATVVGMLGMAMGSTSKLVNGLLAGMMAIGTVGMMFPQAFGAVAGFFRSKLPASAAAGAGKMKIIFTALGRALSASFWPLLAVTAAIGAGFAIYRIATADARKLREENDKIRNSVEGWSEALGYTRTQFGQITNEDGTVEDTAVSLARKMSEGEDENLKALTNRIRANGTDRDKLRSILEMESMKLFADGANPQQVQASIEAMLEAGNVAPQIKKQLLIEFENVKATGLNGVELSSTLSATVPDLFRSRKDNTSSYGDQTALFGGGVGSEYAEWAGRKTGEDTTRKMDLSNKAKENVGQITDAMKLAFQNAKPEELAAVARNQMGLLSDMIAESFNSLPDDVKKQVNDKGGWENLTADMIQGLNASSDVKDNLEYQKNLFDHITLGLSKNSIKVPDYMKFMFKDAESAILALSGTADVAAVDYESAMNTFNSSVVNTDEWEKLDEAQQLAIFNWIRMSAGLAALDGDGAAGLMKIALEQGNLGDRTKSATQKVDAQGKALDGLGDDADGATQEIQDLQAAISAGAKGNWSVTMTINTEGGPLEVSAEDLVNNKKDVMSKVMGDYMEEMQADAQIQMDAEKRAFQDQQKAAQDALSERQKAASKSLDDAQKAEKKGFDKGWKQKIEDENKVYEDRVKAIEDVQDAEDETERLRKRNSDRENRRLKYTQSLMQTGIDINIAMAGGNMDEVARLSANAATAATDYDTESTSAEAGYKKEDEDKARKTAIDLIKEEQKLRIESLEKQKEMEEEAMEKRLEIQKEELAAKQKAESDYLSRRQENENIAYEISFQANQRSLNRELEALRTQIPLNEAELASHMGRVQGAYDGHGIMLMGKGDHWAGVIEDSLIRRTQNATEEMSNEAMWRKFGNETATAMSEGALDMNVDEFNKFIRTGEIPGLDSGFSDQGLNQYGRGPANVRHAGGPIGGGDKYNNRAGIPMNAPMRRDEQNVLAQKGEYMMKRAAHQTYGTETMHAINNGTATVVRHDGGPVGFGGFAGVIASHQAAMMKATLMRTVLATGSAMMDAKTGGGGMMGGGVGEPYGLPIGTNTGGYGSSGSIFPPWVKDVERQFNIRASTYPGHQEGSGLNKGIDWVGASGGAAGVAEMQRFADYLTTIRGQLEQVIWMHPDTGVKTGIFNGEFVGPGTSQPGYYASDWGDHANHVHTRQSFGFGPSAMTEEQKAKAEKMKESSSRFSGWSTPGIDKYRNTVMEKFSPMGMGGDGSHIGWHPDAGVNQWMDVSRQALERTGDLRGDNLARTLKQIDIESTGNPRAINNDDINAVNGTPSKGLLQVIDPTFQDYRDKGLPNDIWNPLSNIVAGINWVKKRWGGIPNRWPTTAGYDEGGVATGEGYLPKYTPKPERVLSPQQTRAFDKLIPMLNGQLDNMGVVGYDSIVGDLARDAGMVVNAAERVVSNAYQNSSSSVGNINITIKDANIVGVDELEKRFEEWGKRVKNEVAKEAVQKERRLGNR